MSARDKARVTRALAGSELPECFAAATIAAAAKAADLTRKADRRDLRRLDSKVMRLLKKDDQNR